MIETGKRYQRYQNDTRARQESAGSEDPLLKEDEEKTEWTTIRDSSGERTRPPLRRKPPGLSREPSREANVKASYEKVINKNLKVAARTSRSREPIIAPLPINPRQKAIEERDNKIDAPYGPVTQRSPSMRRRFEGTRSLFERPYEREKIAGRSRSAGKRSQSENRETHDGREKESENGREKRRRSASRQRIIPMRMDIGTPREERSRSSERSNRRAAIPKDVPQSNKEERREEGDEDLFRYLERKKVENEIENEATMKNEASMKEMEKR